MNRLPFLRNPLLVLSLTLLFVLQVNAEVPNTDFGQVSISCKNVPITTITTLSKKLASLQSLTSPLVIECGEQVTVDSGGSFELPAGLEVRGELNFADGGVAATTLTTPYILVRGKLRIGSKKAPHVSSLRIVLTDLSRDLEIENESKNPLFDSMMNFGRKAFVVYGGSVEIYGAVKGKPYSNLVSSAISGSDELIVSGNQRKSWKSGDKLAIAPYVHDVDGRHTSLVTIKSVSADGKNTRVKIEELLTEDHLVRTHPLTDGTSRIVTMSPEVMKINRNVVISGMPLETDLMKWYQQEESQAEQGGHFTIAHTAEKVVVQGVELVAMGRAGELGRYPLHTHFLGNVAKKSIFSSNSIHHSRQRCIVLHATNKMKVKKNVAYLTTGHCFVTEDGLEKGNKFVQNVAMSYRRARKLINADSLVDRQSDGDAAGFWAASASNDFSKNVAAGGPFGFWFESHKKLRGQSRDAQLPGWETANMGLDNMGKFKSNVAHSNNFALATYPNGLKPLKLAKIIKFFAWSSTVGWQAHIGRNQAMRQSLLVDIFGDGIQAQQQEALEVTDTTIVGHLDNDFHFNCDGAMNRGLSFESTRSFFSWYEGTRGNRFTNVHIQDFTTSRNCRKKNYGFHLKISKDTWWPTSSRFDSVTFDKVDTPMKFDWPANDPYQNQVAFASRNTPVIGGNGFVVSNNFEGENVLAKECSPLDSVDSRLYLCPGQCWRTVSIAYKELTGYGDTIMRFTNTATKEKFEVTPIQRDQWVGRLVDRVVIKVVPAGVYEITIVGQDGVDVPKDLYNEKFFAMYKMDVKNPIPGPACEAELVLQAFGKVIPVDEYH